MLSEKYYTGPYALCRKCSARPCVCKTEAAAPAPLIKYQAKSASGNAMPFIIWDGVIHEFELSIVESGVLIYLCRRTFGYGRHDGAPISIAEVAEALRIGTGTAKRALSQLEQLGLIVRDRVLEPGAKEYGRTHIRVTLE